MDCTVWWRKVAALLLHSSVSVRPSSKHHLPQSPEGAKPTRPERRLCSLQNIHYRYCKMLSSGRRQSAGSDPRRNHDGGRSVLQPKDDAACVQGESLLPSTRPHLAHCSHCELPARLGRFHQQKSLYPKRESGVRIKRLRNGAVLPHHSQRRVHAPP